MNYFSERARLLIAGIKHIDGVLESRYNQVKRATVGLSPEIEAEADRRLEICLDCPFNSVNARTSPEYKALTGQSYSTTRDELHCSLCSCPIHYKVLSMGTACGANEWNNANPGKYVQPKWFTYPPTT
ncbi:hypothetical protein CLV58_109145 [Spirosoma oryzae]|uniref:Uncharacterized protein n=1 Tax=Spirosoma oryzae TaxID=1469603 RepID=A0A2T0SYC2_9BACT|nr:hypothetical protein [Spirosoma oryzae]PRY38418.1 hypothetical protein CLV58_109145 [Spirosoma oryzae]